MKINSRLIVKEATNEPTTFPCVKRLKGSPGIVVLFFSPNTGVHLAYDDSPSRIGAYTNGLINVDDAAWEPFVGKIELDIQN